MDSLIVIPAMESPIVITSVESLIVIPLHSLKKLQIMLNLKLALESDWPRILFFVSLPNFRQYDNLKPRLGLGLRLRLVKVTVS